MDASRGILLLAHGGPGTLDEIPAFLEHVRGGRPCSEQLTGHVREKYRFIGGRSPLPDITRRTAAKLQAACELPVYVGMLHWHPFLEDAIARMVSDGVRSALVICLVPHFSRCSVGRYQSRAGSAADACGLTVDFVDSWHLLSPYIGGLAESIAASQSRLASASDDPTHVVFSAHSLPNAALALGDPYERQLHETARAVSDALALPREGWTVAYQSASGPAKDWLGPSVEEVILDLSKSNIHEIVLCPFGFVADQVEILFDLDVILSQKARELGTTVARTRMLNDCPALVDSLALLVEGWRK